MLVVLADTTQLGKLFHVFTQTAIDRILHPIACTTVRIKQSLFETRFANWHFSLPNKSNLAFFEGVWQRKISVGLNGEKYLATMFVTSSKFQK